MVHPDENVRLALIQLCDAICSWNLTTGRGSVLVLREEGGFCFRAESGKPLIGRDDVPDKVLFDRVATRDEADTAQVPCSHRDVPYFTSSDESKPCGHIYRRRERRVRGRWGFAWEVYGSYADEPCGGGWRVTQEEAEQAMNDALSRM